MINNIKTIVYHLLGLVKINLQNMKKNIKLKIDIQLTSEDEDKIERLLMELISKTTSLVNNEVKKKNRSMFENSIKVDCEYTTSVERN